MNFIRYIGSNNVKQDAEIYKSLNRMTTMEGFHLHCLETENRILEQYIKAHPELKKD